jgi:FdhE protein
MTRILSPGQIEEAAHLDFPQVKLPEKNVFSRRAERLRKQAAGHAMADFLRFAAALCEAQQQALESFPAVPLPDAAQLEKCRQHGLPPLGVAMWPRHPAWRKILAGLLTGVSSHANARTGELIGRVLAMEDAQLEEQAARLLAGEFGRADLGCAPLVASGLQVYWTHLARSLPAGAIGKAGPGNLCPVCGSHPVASTVRIGGAEQGLRYLTCSLCSSEWHLVRVRCVACESARDLTYFSIDNEQAAIKAEGCGECKSYLKIVYMDKDPEVEPVADDLATLALDLMLAEEGYGRSGVNLFLIPGAE